MQLWSLVSRREYWTFSKIIGFRRKTERLIGPCSKLACKILFTPSRCSISVHWKKKSKGFTRTQLLCSFVRSECNLCYVKESRQLRSIPQLLPTNFILQENRNLKMVIRQRSLRKWELVWNPAECFGYEEWWCWYLFEHAIAGYDFLCILFCFVCILVVLALSIANIRLFTWGNSTTLYFVRSLMIPSSM